MKNIVIHRDAGPSAVHLGQQAEVAAFGLIGSPLSPWYAGCISYQGYHFTSVAQLVAWARARFFRAEEIASEILTIKDPRVLRQTAQRVPADESVWRPRMQTVMPAAMRALVAQNIDSLIALLSTGRRRIAFAVQNDLTWGAGMLPDDPAIARPDAWPGRNLLGFILEELRTAYCGEVLSLFDPAGKPRPLDRNAIAEVMKLVEACFSLADDLYDREFVRPAVRLDLKGTTAGMAVWVKGSKASTIRFNPILLAENWSAFRDRTVPHEVAHLVARDLYGENVRAHGAEWQAVMKDFGCDATRCHSYSVVNASTHRGRRDVMSCHCRIHLVSPRQGGAPPSSVRCRICNKTVQFVISEADLGKRVSLS